MSNTTSRISRKRLEEIAGHLSLRDMDILQSIKKCRYLSGNQVRRLHFNNSSSSSAASRASNRSLLRLKNFGILQAITRRIGGIRAGSGPNIWSLTPAGFKLLNLNAGENVQRKRSFEPSSLYLKHTLTVAETFVQLNEICRRNDLKLENAELEPICWRVCSQGSKPQILKPDLYAVVSGQYEDSWFLEVDLATESYPAVIRKCERYLHYHSSGIEQNRHGVFPFIVWIVPDVRRRNKLTKHIFNEFKSARSHFLVILPMELEDLILLGAEQFMRERSQKEEQGGGE